ncbi:MAG TPA: gluconate 2-dehydrogenase subunit 3 family protein [Candidatus Dormibacteraeota bacterium]
MPASSRYRDPGHLPNRRPGRQPEPAEALPRQRAGMTPQMVGRYPEYDVMREMDSWDPTTRDVVEDRLKPSGPLRFFACDEVASAHAFCDTVTAQHHEPRIPVVAMIDKKYAAGRLDGFRYDDMPEDGETWHRALAGLDAVARQRYRARFADCAADVRHAICEQFARGELKGGVWDGLNCKRAFSVMMRGVVSAFYSHPWAWNEIGFGGPAYPRGFMRLGEGVREPFEKPEAVSDDPVREAAAPRT